MAYLDKIKVGNTTYDIQDSNLKSALNEVTESKSNLLYMINTDVITSGVNITTNTADIITFVSGTSTSGGGRNKKICEPFMLEAGTYTFSAFAQNESAQSLRTRIKAYIVKSVDDTTLVTRNGAGSTTFTLDEATEVYASVGPTTTATTYDNAVFAAMLNAGTEALPYTAPSMTACDFVARDELEGLRSDFVDFDETLYWHEKTIVCFGDSRTWYDGQTYSDSMKPEWAGKTCVGYQEILRRMLKATIINQGVSGNTSPQISARIRAYDFTGVDGVVLAGGVNDFIRKVPLGDLQAVGSTFDTATIYGAWQSAIEYIQTNYPDTHIFIVVPAISWNSLQDVFPYYIASVKKNVANLYDLPFVDLYKTLGITTLNRNYFYADTSAWTHFNDYGNELIGLHIAGLVDNYASATYVNFETVENAGKVIETSKNLLHLKAGSVSLGTVTLSITDENSIVFSGDTTSGTGRTVALSGIFYLKPGTYTLSCKYDTPGAYAYRTRMRCYIVNANDNSVNLAAMTTGSPVTFTVTEETAVFFSCSTANNSTYNNYKLYVMLNAGEAEDYVSPKQISAVDSIARDVTIPTVGKRLIERNYSIGYANAVKPLSLKNIYNTTENVHPKVIYFANGLFGHKYWMAYTPYTNEDVTEENPCIAYSDDGIAWTNIENNPLDTGTTGAYLSDTHLVYNNSTGLLECWYRLAVSTDPANEYIYRQTSADGLTWGNKELLRTGDNGAKAHLLSPAVIFENGTYKIWVVSNKSGYHIEYFETSDATDWGTKVKDITLTYATNGYTFRPWHIDVVYVDGKYIMLVMCKGDTTASPDAPWTLFATESTDNDGYLTPFVIIEPNLGAWDSDLYRSCLVKADQYMIYYSARHNTTQGMSISVADSLYKFIGYDMFK